MDLPGKVALVTGAGSGIGAATARLLAAHGAAVVATDVNRQSAQRIATEIVDAGGRASGVELDVTSEARWIEVVEEVAHDHGRLDIMVSNAGIIVVGSTLEMSLADWQRQNAVNIDGVFLSVKHCVPLMRVSGGGSVIIMSSAGGIRGSAKAAGYCASKGAVRLFAKATALEFSDEPIVRVNSVHPGVVVTPIMTAPDGTPFDISKIGDRDTPIGRSAQPEEIAQAVLYLASDASSYVTGSELVIDGGIGAGAMPSRRK